MDCLSPPSANPPAISNDFKYRRTFRCPRHVDHDLENLEWTSSSGLLQRRTRVKDERYSPGKTTLGADPALHRLRQAKKPEIVTPAISRGLPNNGAIDLEDDEDWSEFYDEDEEDDEGNQVVQRLPTRTVKLDFIERVKNIR